MLTRTFLFSQLCAWLALIGGCGVDAAVGQLLDPNHLPHDGGLPAADSDLTAPSACAYGQIVCVGSDAKVCDGQGGFTASVTTCAIECQPGLGCVHCMPNTGSCSDGYAKVCDPTGSSESTFVCAGEGMTCDPDGCKGPCSPQELGSSYQGCEFWPTVTANRVWGGADRQSGFHFGLLLGNVSSSQSVSVVVSHGASEQKLTIGPSEAKPVSLDWIDALKGSDWTMPFVPASSTASAVATAAYRVRSTGPLIAYQFNPIEDKLPGTSACPSLSGGNGGCYSYSSDASLLIPSHVLSKHYVATGYHAWHEDPFPRADDNRLSQGDFLAITATQANTVITLGLRSGQMVLPTAGGALTDESGAINLGAGDAVELFTPGASELDSFSGTVIDSTHPVQVLSGMACASIPEDTAPCGHVEDPVLPLEALGKNYVLPTLHAPSGESIARSLRIQAVTDGTALSFTPTTFNNITLNAGEVSDIADVTVNLSISANQDFAVTEYMHGRGDVASPGSDGQNVGGPAQWSVTPNSQFRTDYVFMASPSFEVNTVSIVAPTGALVTLDDKAVPPEAFMAVEKSGMSVARQSLYNNGRVHHIHSDKAVGIAVYGFSPFSNYLVSGGLDFRSEPVPVR